MPPPASPCPCHHCVPRFGSEDRTPLPAPSQERVCPRASAEPRGGAEPRSLAAPKCCAHPPQCFSTRRKGERCQTSHSSAVGTRNRPGEKQIIPRTFLPGLTVRSQPHIAAALAQTAAAGLRCVRRSERTRLAEGCSWCQTEHIGSLPNPARARKPCCTSSLQLATSLKCLQVCEHCGRSPLCLICTSLSWLSLMTGPPTHGSSSPWTRLGLSGGCCDWCWARRDVPMS